MKKLVTTLTTQSSKLAQELHALNNSNKPLQGYCKYNQVAQHLLSAYCTVVSHPHYPSSHVDLDTFRQNMTSVWQQLSQYNSEKYNSRIRKAARLLTQLQQLRGPASSIRRYFIRVSLSDCTRTIHECTWRSYYLHSNHWKVLFESTVCDKGNQFHPEQIKMIQRHGPSTGVMEFWNNEQRSDNEQSVTGTTLSHKVLNLTATLQVRMNYHNRMYQLYTNSSNGKEKQKLKRQLKLSNMLSRTILDDLISCDAISTQDKENYQQLRGTLLKQDQDLDLHEIMVNLKEIDYMESTISAAHITTLFTRPNRTPFSMARPAPTQEHKRMVSVCDSAGRQDDRSFSKEVVHFPLKIS